MESKGLDQTVQVAYLKLSWVIPYFYINDDFGNCGNLEFLFFIFASKHIYGYLLE